MKNEEYISHDKLYQLITIKVQMITVMAVAAGMVLVLKHPQNTGPVRNIHEAFLGMLGDIITDTGLMTKEQFELFKRGEFQVEVTVDPGKAVIFGPGSMN